MAKTPTSAKLPQHCTRCGAGGEDKPSEPAPFGSNYNEKPFSKEEKQKANEQIKIGVDPKRAEEKSISNNKKAVFGR